MSIISEITKDSVLNYIATEGKRIDGRGFDDYREIKVEKGFIKSAEGSALVSIGKTKVLVGVKVDPAEPFSDRPGEGIISTNAELLPLAYKEFETGPPNEDSIELARVVDRGIRSADIIDTASLKINEEKVWGIFIDIYVLDYDGNLMDAAALAAMAALTEAYIPKYDEQNKKVIRDRAQGKPLPLRGIVTECTFAKMGGKIMIDPCLEEEMAMEGRLTIGIMDKYVVSGQKAEQAAFTQEELFACIDKAFAKHETLKKLAMG